MDLDQIAHEIDADARRESGRSGTDLDKLRRYGLLSRLSGYTIGDLICELPLAEIVAERKRLGRQLTKDDYVQVLTAKALSFLD